MDQCVKRGHLLECQLAYRKLRHRFKKPHVCECGRRTGLGYTLWQNLRTGQYICGSCNPHHEPLFILVTSIERGD